MTDRQLNLPPCKGLNCGTTTGRDHSPECEAEHAAAIAGGTFVPAAPAAQPEQRDERAAFEAKWPTPFNCVWTGTGYSATVYGAWSARRHIDRWEGWQAHAALSAAPAAPQERPCHCERACVPEGEVCSRCGGVGQFRPAAPQEPSDVRCPDCLGSEFPGFKRGGVRCATCNGTATVVMKDKP